MSLATAKQRVYAAILSVSHVNYRDSQLIGLPVPGIPIAISANGLTVSQERGFGSNHLVFLKARPQHAMGRCELRILGYTRYNTRNISSSIFNWPEVVPELQYIHGEGCHFLQLAKKSKVSQSPHLPSQSSGACPL